jgi:hypothetical protein
MASISCPYCNAMLVSDQIRPAGQKFSCPRCGEPLPAYLIADLPTPPATVPAPATVSPRTDWTNRRIGWSVLGIMSLMAVCGLIFALLTQEYRRKNDYRMKKDTTPPPTVQAPGELAGLGYLPPEVNVVAAVQVAELFKDRDGKQLLEAPRPAVLDLALGLVEKRTKLKAEEVDHIVLGTEIKAKLPQLTVVVRTRAPYDAAALAKTLLPAAPTRHRGGLLFRFDLRPGQGMLWCPQPQTLVLLLRLNAFKTEDLDAIPLTPRKDADAPPQAVREILTGNRVGKQSLAWIAGSVDDPGLVKELLALGPLTDVRGSLGDFERLKQVRSFGLSLVSQNGLALDANFRTNDTKAARLVREHLEGLKFPDLKLKVEGPPPEVTAAADQWVTLQIRGDLGAFRAALGRGMRGIP